MEPLGPREAGDRAGRGVALADPGEAAQLGRFPEVAEFYVIGRGLGISPLCAFQDISQPRENLGPNGATTLSASAALPVAPAIKMFIGIVMSFRFVQAEGGIIWAHRITTMPPWLIPQRGVTADISP